MMATKRETAKALAGSIEKWRAIVEKTGEDRGHDNCPLCDLFWALDGCDECPVAKKTGEKNCVLSPYESWTVHHANKHFRKPNVAHCPTCTRLARAELKFLEGLVDA